MTKSKERIVDIQALYEALDKKRIRFKLTWKQAAWGMGVSASTLSRMNKGKSPDVEGFAKMTLWLDVSADVFIEGSKKQRSQRLSREHLLSNIIEIAYRSYLQIK